MNAALIVTPSSNWYSAAVTCVGETFCAVAAYNFVVLYDRGGTSVKAVLRAHSHKVTAVTAAQGCDEEVVLSGGRDKVLIAWSVKRQCVLRKQKKLPAEITALAVCPDDTETAMVALSNGDIALWNWKKGGRQNHAGALPSAASVLTAVQIPSEQSGVVLAGCENGTVVGLKSTTAEQLWMVDVNAASDPKKSRMFKNSKNSGGSKGGGGKKGVQDMALTEVKACCYEGLQQGHGTIDRSGHSQPAALLLAVTTRTCQLAIFGWFLHGTDCTSGFRSSNPTEHVASQSCGASDCEAMHRPPGIPESSSSTADNHEHAPSACVHKPSFLENLSVPPPASEVSWLPICWLPNTAACNPSELHDPLGPSTSDLDLCTDLTELTDTVATREQGHTCCQQLCSDVCHTPDTSVSATVEPVNSTQYNRSESHSISPLASHAQGAWMLLGLPSGRMCVWNVKVNGTLLHDLSSSQSGTDVAIQGRTSHSSEAGSWRRSSALEAKPIKLNADDMHARMLFTIHAMPGSDAVSGKSAWQIVTTSYDRKTVSWDFSISEDGENARMKVRRAWTGTGADVLGLCIAQGQNSKMKSAGQDTMFVATGEKHLRRYHWLQADSPNGASMNSKDSIPQQLYHAASGSTDLFFQGIGSEIASLFSIDTLIVAGCSDGTVGIVDTQLPAAKARFARFSMRHEGSVVSCVAWKSGSSVQRGGSEGHKGDTTEALEVFSLGADGTALQWRGLPALQDLLSMLRNNTGVDKLSALPKPTQLAVSIPDSIAQIGHVRSMSMVQSYLLLGGSHGHLLVLQPPEPGEHSINAALQSPDLNHVGVSLLHSVAVTAVAGVPRASCGGTDRAVLGQSSAKILVAAASMLGSVALVTVDPHPCSSDPTLVCVAMLTDVGSAVTALQLAPHPPVSAVCDHGIHDSSCYAASGGTSSATEGNRAAVGDLLEHTVEPEPGWVLCAAASENVHVWSISQYVDSECTDAPNEAHSVPCEHSIVYGGPIKGLGHTAAPVCMRIVGQQSFDCVSDNTSTSRSVPCPTLSLVVACTDRSIRAWPLSKKLVDINRSTWLSEQQAKEAERAARSQAHCQKSSADETIAVPQAHKSIQESPSSERACAANAAPQQGVNNELETPHKQTPEAQRRDSSPTSDQLECRADPVLATELHTGPGEHQNVPNEIAQQGDKALGPKPSSVLHTQVLHEDQQDISANSALQSNVGETLLPLAHAQRQPAADSPMRPLNPEGHKAHAGSTTVSSTRDSVASRLSRYVGVRKTTEVSRLRPRACTFGAQSMLQPFVDQKLAAWHGKPSKLPGTSASAIDAEGLMTDVISFHASEDAAQQSTGASQKPATSTRNAAHAAAQRTALIQLWQGRVCEALDTVIEADALNADFVAMSMGAGPEVWRAVVALYATQLAACGEINLAVSYLCSAGDFEQAVMLYKNSGHTLEALLLAERHMPPSSGIMHTLRSSLQTQLTQGGGDEPPAAPLNAWSVQLAIANGDLQGAVQMLVPQNAVCSGELLGQACRKLVKERYNEAAAELCSRVALGCTGLKAQKGWLDQALHQDAGISCVALAIGIVQELLIRVLQCLVSIRAATGSEEITLSDALGRVTRCCSEFTSALLCNMPSSKKITFELVPTSLLQTVLERAMSAMNGVDPMAATSMTEQKDSMDSPSQARASDITQKHLQIVAQAILVCVDAALSCVDNQLLLPGHREDLAKRIPRLQQPIFPSVEDKQASEKPSIDLAARFVSTTLVGPVYQQDSTAPCGPASSDVLQYEAAMDAWARCAGQKCLHLCSSPLDCSLDGIASGSKLQPTAWHSTVMELLLRLPQEGHAAHEDPALECYDSCTTAGTAVDHGEGAAQEAVVPVVTVLDSALRELNDLTAGRSDTETQHSSPRTPRSPLWLASPDPSLRSERARSERVNQSHCSGSKADDQIHWTDVEAYHRTVQAYTPQVWAAFRQEALAGEVTSAPGVGDLSTRSVPAGALVSGVVELAQDVSSRDIVLSGWSRALRLHPGSEMKLA